MKVINLIGGPNTGKSTAAFGLMYRMKKLGLRVQYVGEYATEMVQEDRANILGDQLYILAKQNRRLHRLRSHSEKFRCEADYVVTDTSLLHGIVYAAPDDPPELEALIWSKFNSYDNEVFYIPRNFSFDFQVDGRVQKSHEEAVAFDHKFLALLAQVPSVHYLPVSDDYVEPILNVLGLKEPKTK